MLNRRIAWAIEDEIRLRMAQARSPMFDATSPSGSGVLAAPPPPPEPVTITETVVEQTSWQGDAPAGDAPLVQRIAYCLNVNQLGFQRMFKLKPDEARRLWREKSKRALPAMDEDELWAHIYNRVCEAIALSMAVREELNRKLAEDRKQRVARRAAYTER